MIAGELAHCRHLHLAGIGLGVLNEILKRLIRTVLGDHDHVGVVNEAAKRAELLRLVARLPFGAQHGLEHDMGRSTPPMVYPSAFAPTSHVQPISPPAPAL